MRWLMDLIEVERREGRHQICLHSRRLLLLLSLQRSPKLDIFIFSGFLYASAEWSTAEMIGAISASYEIYYSFFFVCAVVVSYFLAGTLRPELFGIK